jgi:hypothetical protein
MSMDVYASSWEANYHNTKPFFLHDYGCHCGDMDAADDGVLHSMLFHSDTELAFGVVYNTGYGWGNYYTTNSSSAMQQKSFWDYLFDVANNSGDTDNWQLGKAQEYARDLMAPTINWDPYYGTWRGIIECCLFFGDPAQKLKPPFPPGPRIDYSPESYDFGAMPQGATDSTVFDVWNEGQDVLHYETSSPDSWISVVPTSGTCEGTEVDHIQVTVDTTGLTFGPYTGEVIITSDGGDEVFTVYVDVDAQGTEVLDIEQDIYSRGFPIRYAADGSWGGAQSFIPTVSILTRTEVYLRKFGTPSFDLKVEIREDSPEGPLVDTIIFTSDEVSSSWTWLNINMVDTAVTPDTSYFIVLTPPTTNPGNSFGYEWGYAFGNKYDNGAFWFTRDGGGLWRDLPDNYEFTFRTYGIE